MMALAVLCATADYTLAQAMHLIQTKRYVVDFAEVYVRSVERFLAGEAEGKDKAGKSRKDGNRL
jgi:hypothetical protein